MSQSTIRRLIGTPDKGNSANFRYNGYIHAKVGTKSNSYREPHIDAHCLFARNKLRRELGSLFSTDISILSYKKVGAPAVSSYHQIKDIYPGSEGPIQKKRDFPYPGYLLIVSGFSRI